MVPNKFCLVILSENEDVNVREMFFSFCKKFRINRFEPNFCIRSSQKSVEEKVNLSKYHLFLSVVENKMDEVRLYGQEQCYKSSGPSQENIRPKPPGPAGQKLAARSQNLQHWSGKFSIFASKRPQRKITLTYRCFVWSCKYSFFCQRTFGVNFSG